MQVNHDKKLLIATGRSRKATQWQNREMLWSEFLDKLSRPTRTRETAAYSSGVTVRESGMMSRSRIFSGVWLWVE